MKIISMESNTVRMMSYPVVCIHCIIYSVYILYIIDKVDRLFYCPFVNGRIFFVILQPIMMRVQQVESRGKKTDTVF